MTNEERKVIELALEALEGFYEYGYDRRECFEHITAIKEALAQPEQEPVAWMNDSTPSGIFARHTEGAKNFGCTIPLYTTPPQRTWVGLTDEEIADCAEKMEATDPTDSFWREFFRDIEAKLKEKNHA